jgi:hypothetical protein
MVKIYGWPTNVSTNYFIVTEVVDQDTVILGKDLPAYTVVGVLTPTLTFVDPLLDTGFSDRQSITVDFGPSFAGNLVSFEVDEFKYLESVQQYLELPERRLVCADLLARGFDIYLLDIGVTVYDTNIPTTGELTILITEFLNGMTPGDELILADLVAHITNSGINKLKTPLSVTYSYYTKDMFPAQTGSITDVLKPLNSTSVFLLENVTSASDTI